ncbi:DUF7673 family protein [Achromobacter kerstersii]|uniref:Nucleoid occlusion protein n=1 Tax=Achromobacter kerstersii TaxID=1353890 RepID=A0A6S7AQ81_9BURK|nr:ParB/RepB/Spo0J family partition protein [Achromobacter kerstersii]CAB3743289.1 Nucleoid occlusion protein [Achromobacter kerstersii]
MSLAAKQGGSDLDLAGLGDLASFLDGPQRQVGEPDLFDMDIIDEDRNVRLEYNPGLSKESIDELRESLRRDGMLSPISLRPNPARPGRYLINFGHRRFRAAKAEGWRQVPGIIRHKFDRFAQMAENMKREGITALEIAEFIRDELAEGRTQSEIAGGLGKSKAWVTQHAKMLDLPPTVAEAVASGKVTDVTLASELAVAHREDPQAVADLLNATETKPTRSAVKAIRKAAGTKEESPEAPSDETSPSSHNEATARAVAAQCSTYVFLANEPSSPPADGALPPRSTFVSTAGEIPAEVKAEFQRRRNVLEQEQRDAANPALRQAGMDSLNRLIEIARRDTNQSKRVADFLLAWWNATSCGGFDLADLWSVDKEIYDDMSSVIALVRRSRSYPDTLTTPVHEAFKELVKIWRPQLVNE